MFPVSARLVREALERVLGAFVDRDFLSVERCRVDRARRARRQRPAAPRHLRPAGCPAAELLDGLPVGEEVDPAERELPAARAVGRMTQTPIRSSLPARSKAMRRPDGEKVGANSSCGAVVSCVSFEPSTSMTQMSPLRENTIRVAVRGPVGALVDAGTAGQAVQVRPVGAMTQMSSGAARSLVNTIRVPSGDHSGNASKRSVVVKRD